MSNIQTNQVIEHERIKSLKKYNILDTPPDGSFDHITKLAAKLLDVPIAIITLVDTDRIWFKSRYGLDAQQIGRDPGLCASAILSDELYVVEDAAKDARTLSNPLVANQVGLRFYAAVPIKVKGGHNLGTLCVIDKRPRQITDSQKETLQYLADILIDQLELRLAARTANYQQNQVLSMAAHDLKSPLTTINMWADLTSQVKDNPDEVEKNCSKVKESAKKMERLINELLESASKEAGNVELSIKKSDFAGVVEKVVSSNQIVANSKNLKLNIHIRDYPQVNADEDRLTEIAENLINNAIKYSPKNKNVDVIVSEKNGKAILEVRDEGQGITEEDKKNLFQRFVRLSARPTGGENSTGLGLSIVKSLVEAHNGTIKVESDGKDKGAAFIVELEVCK